MSFWSHDLSGLSSANSFVLSLETVDWRTNCDGWGCIRLWEQCQSFINFSKATLDARLDSCLMVSERSGVLGILVGRAGQQYDRFLILDVRFPRALHELDRVLLIVVARGVDRA